MNNIVNSDPGRVLTSLSFERPSHPAICLSLAMQASRTTNLPLSKILRDPEKFAQAQIDMHERWQHDVAIGMMYAAAEAEAFGASVDFFEDGPPNVASILVETPFDLAKMPEVNFSQSVPLSSTLHVISSMKSKLQGKALVSAVAVGPLSGPVMWMGMERWIEVLMTDSVFTKQVFDKYSAFSTAWARRQIEAGADLLTWFEPFASTSILPLKLITQMIGPSLKSICSLGVPVALHLASAPSFDIAELAYSSGVKVLSIGLHDDAHKLRMTTDKKLTLIGPIDGIGLHHWKGEKIAAKTRQAVDDFGHSGGLILSDAHGEIPWQVAPEKIDVLVKAVRSV